MGVGRLHSNQKSGPPVAPKCSVMVAWCNVCACHSSLSCIFWCWY